MGISIVLAQFWGWLLIIPAALFLVHSSMLPKVLKLVEERGFTSRSASAPGA